MTDILRNLAEQKLQRCNFHIEPKYYLRFTDFSPSKLYFLKKKKLKMLRRIFIVSGVLKKWCYLFSLYKRQKKSSLFYLKIG